MTARDYIAGLLWLAATLAPAVGAAEILRRRRFGHLLGSERVLALGVLATVAVMLTQLLPLVLGVLARGTAVAAGAALLAVALATPRAKLVDPPATDEGAASPPAERMALPLATATAAVAGVALLAAVKSRASMPFTNIDTVTFHLPNVVRWIQSGTVWQIDQFLPLQAQGNYPNNGELLMSALVVPWHNDFAIRVLSVPFLALTALGVYVLGLRLRSSRAAAILFAAVVVTLPIVTFTAFANEMPDPIMYAGFAAGLAFLTRHWYSRRRADLVLAGLALGIAFGTKWYGVPAVMVVGLAWLASSLGVRRRAATIAGDSAVLIATVGGAGGFWMLRNWIESGDPVFPAKVAPLGLTIFDAPPDRLRALAGFRLSDYITDAPVWRHYVLPAFSQSFGLAAVVLALGVAAAVVAGLKRSSTSGWRIAPVVVLAGLAAALFVVYLFTPYSALGGKGHPALIAANSRYAVPALAAAAGATAWAASRSGLAGAFFRLAAVAAVADGLRRGAHAGVRDLVTTAVALTVVTAAVLAISRRLRSRDSPAMATWAAAAAGAACLLVLAAAGWHIQHRFNMHRYYATDSTVRWVNEHAAVGRRVGLAGNWDIRGIYPVLPMFGPRFRNHVGFVGHFVRGFLTEYGDPRSFTTALDRGRYDLLVIGRGDPPRRRVREQSWVERDGFVMVAASPRLVLYQRGGRTA